MTTRVNDYRHNPIIMSDHSRDSIAISIEPEPDFLKQRCKEEIIEINKKDILDQLKNKRRYLKNKPLRKQFLKNIFFDRTLMK